MPTISQVQEVVYRQRYEDQGTAAAAAATKAIEGVNAAIAGGEAVVTRSAASASTLINRWDAQSKSAAALARAQRDLAAIQAAQATDAATGGAKQDALTRSFDAAQAKVVSLTAAVAGGSTASTAAAIAAQRTVDAHDALAASANKTSFAMRNLSIQGIQAASGIATGMPVMQVLIQQGHQVFDSMLAGGAGMGLLGEAAKRMASALFSPIGIAAALGVGLYSLGSIAESEANRLGNLRQQLRATHDDYAALAQQVDATSRKVAASSTLSTSDARGAAQTIAGAKYYAGTASDLERLTRLSGDLARVWNVDVSQAAERLAQAINDPAAAAKAFAEKGLPAFTGVLAQQVDVLQRAGKQGEAFTVVLGALTRASSGSKDDSSALTTALHELEQSFYGAQTGGKSLATTLGDFVNQQAAYVVRGLRNVIEVIKGVKDAAASVPGVDDFGRTIPGTEPRASPSFSGSQQDFVTALIAGAQRVQAATGINASNTIGQLGLETGWGKSVYGNNFGNIRARDGYTGDTVVNPGDGARYRAYASVDAFFDDYIKVMQGDRYADARAAGKDAAGYSAAIGRSGYAEAPNYGSAVLGAIGSVNRIAPGIDASGLTGVVDQGKAAADAIAKMAENSRALTGVKLEASLEDVIKQMRGLEQAGKTDTVQYAALRQEGERLAADLYKNVDAQTAANRANESATRANAGRTAAEQAINAALEQRNQLALESGTPFTAADKAKLMAELSTRQAQELERLNFQLANTGAASLAMAAAYGSGNQAVIDATASQQAYNEALKLVGPDAANFAQVQQGLIDVFKRVNLAAAEAKTAQSNAAANDNLTIIAAETASIGMNQDARTKMVAVMKAEQEMHRQFGDTLPKEAQDYIDLAGRTAEATAAYQRQQQTLGDVTGAISSAADTLSNSLTQAFIDNGGAAVNWANILKSVETQVGGLVAKLLLINPILNAIDGGSRSTFSSVLGLLGGGSSLDTSSAASFVVGASAGAAGYVFNSQGSTVPEDQLTAADRTMAGKTGTVGANGQISLSTIASVGGAAAKALDFVGGGKILSGVKDFVYNLVGFTPGQSIGQWVSGLVGEEVSAGAAGGTTGILGGAASAEAGSATASAAGQAAAAVGESGVGTIGAAASAVIEYLPYIGAAITIITDLATGNLRGAAIVATTTAIGAAVGTIIPGVGTAIGAAVGATVGVLIDTFFPAHPMNPYSFTTVGIQDGQLAVTDQKTQLASDYSDAARKQATDLGTALAAFNKGVGLKIANPEGTTIGIFGTDPNAKNGKPTEATLESLFKNLAFDADPSAADATSNFGIARHAVSGMKFDTFGALGDEVVKIARFADGMDQLGIKLASVGTDLTNISVASVSLTGALTDQAVATDAAPDPLRVALSNDLPRQTYANVDALAAEIDKVNTFVNGTMPGMLNPVLKTSSSILDALAANVQKYTDAINQAQSYGLDTAPLADAMNKANALIWAAPTKALSQTRTSSLDRAISASDTSSPDQVYLASYRETQTKYEQEQDSLITSLKQTFGDGIVGTQYYYDQLGDLMTAQAAELAKSQRDYVRARNTSWLSIVAAVGSVQARAFALGGDQTTSDLINFDTKAAQERDAYSNQLVDFYGAQYAASADYQARMTLLEQVQQGERLKIAQQSATAAQSAVRQLVTGLADYAAGLQTSNLSPLSPQDQLEAARRQFQAVSGAAAAGDYNSLQKVQSYADTFLNASRAVNGSGSQYVSDFQQVVDALGSVASVSIDAATNSAIKAALQDQTATLQAELQRLQALVVALTLEVKQSGNAPARVAA